MSKPLVPCIVAGLLGIASLSRPAAAAWPTDPNVNLAVSTAPGSQTAPAVAQDGEGGVFVAWQGLRDTIPDVYVQHVLASGTVDPAWPAHGLAIGGPDSTRLYPLITADGAGGALVAWMDFHAGNADIYVQHVLAGGIDPAWPSQGRAACTEATFQQGIQIVTDGAGGAIVAWYDQRNYATQYTDIYAQHVLANGTVDVGWPVDGLNLCPIAAADQSTAALVPDAAGGAIAAWADTRDGNYDVYAQRVLASGVLAPTWPAGGRALTTNTEGQFSPAITAVDAGAVVVTWLDFRQLGSTDIYAHRVLTNGELDPAWPGNGLAICTDPGLQYYPVIVGDGAGGAIVSWWDFRDDDGSQSNADIYAQRALMGGTVDPGWPVDGRALCTLPKLQTNPRIVTDGAGGGIVAWLDYRNDDGSYTNSDIFAQRVLASGAVDPEWPAGGSAVSTAPRPQGNSAIGVIPVGEGGAILAWDDLRNDELLQDSDIYAQRILSNGLLGGGGGPSCLEVGFEFLPGIFNLGSKGTWVTGFVRVADPRRATDIDPSSVRLGGVPAADATVEGDYLLKLRFPRDAVTATLAPGHDLVVTVTGTIGGECFAGTDTIRVLSPRFYSPARGAQLTAGTTVEVAWEAPPGAGPVSMLSTSDDGVTWRVEVASLENTGRFPWAVPAALAGTIRLAIVTIHDTDETSIDNRSGWAISEPFVVRAVADVGAERVELSVRPASNPTFGSLAVRVGLSGAAPATLEVFDVGGRAIVTREVGGLGPGRHTLRLGRLPVGHYVVRLSQAGRRTSSRVAILD